MEWWSGLTALLQLLHSYTEQQEEWERYLPFVLFAYRTAVHTSTGVSPFEMMFGRPPVQHPFLLELHMMQCHTRVS